MVPIAPVTCMDDGGEMACPSALNWKLVGVAAKVTLPCAETLKGLVPVGPVRGVSQVDEPGSEAMVRVTLVELKLTHTVRRCAIAAFWA